MWVRFSVFRYSHQIKIICCIKRRTGHQFASSEELPLAPLCVPAHTGRVLSRCLFWAVTRVLLPQPGAYLSGCSHAQSVLSRCRRRGAEWRFIQCLQESPAGPLWWTLAPRLAAKRELQYSHLFLTTAHRLYFTNCYFSLGVMAEMSLGARLVWAEREIYSYCAMSPFSQCLGWKLWGVSCSFY